MNLSLSTGAVTRANGALPTDNGSVVGSNEGTLNHICVGLFDANNKLVTLYEYDYSGDENISTRTDAVQMLIFANVPTGAFAGKYILSDFYTVAQDLGYTTSVSGKSNTGVTTANSQSMKSLPMMSDVQTLNWGSGTTLSPTVTLNRMVARVALTNITYSFTGSYNGCSFTPTEVFMYNASNQLTNWNTKTVSGNVSGENIAGNANTAYLGSGTISTYSAPYYFYVFPHGSTSPTKLVIKGTFKTNSGTTYTTYYPIIVNSSSTGNIVSTIVSGTGDSKISANTTYGLSVTLNGTGVANVSDELTSANVTVTTSVDNFTSATVSEYFGPKIGDIFYSDGSYSSTLVSGKTPVAIVFSTTTSAADQAKGFRHGYAMALQNAGNSTAAYQWYTSNSGNPTGSFFTTAAQIMADKDGLSHTGTIQTTGYAAGIAAKGYIAKDKSGNNIALSGTSGWYLPSIGQWYDICVNLGGTVSSSGVSYTNTGTDWLRWYSGDDSSGKNYSSLCVSAINVYLNVLKTNGYNVDLFTNNGEVYWSSSEYTFSSAYYGGFGSDGNTPLYSNGKVTICRVRPVLAF
ncbi:hypothetical protein prwr041_20470 [Prevotella herbatica]|uniref:DUF1566 domain-containing protein n=1 Tax=Prevotella herbatica TaxID=2801997 RepID=A0ABN6EJY6_9BACT|nr:hypothetical protein prwr041_20470 [Prevotella herbatica]